MPEFNAQSFREHAFNTPRKTQDIATPWWPQFDGHMALGDVPTPELTALQPLNKSDPAAYSAALVIKTLIIKDTGEQAFQDADRDMLNQNGSIVLSLMQEINKFFGFDAKAAMAAAKNG